MESGLLRGLRGVGQCVLALVLGAGAARADAVLLIEQPVNFLGHVSSTGHSAIYLDGVCTDDHVRVRLCGAGEPGVVVSRYKDLHGYDWVAMEPEPYLYALESGSPVPETVTSKQVETMRAEYRDAHLAQLTAGVDEGYWMQLLGGAYRRKIFCLRVHTTIAENMRAVNWLNGRRNKTHFNFFWSNCADFSRGLLNAMYPGAVHRNLLFDAEITTPKQLASGLHGYERKHPRLGWDVGVIDQVPGDVSRSGKLRGVTESFVKTTPYLLPLVALQPEGLGVVTASGLLDRRYDVQTVGERAPRLEGNEPLSFAELATR